MKELLLAKIASKYYGGDDRVKIFYLFIFQYYESLLAEAKAKREVLISEAVEKTVNSKLLDLQTTLEKCTEATKAVAAVGVFSVGSIFERCAQFSL